MKSSLSHFLGLSGGGVISLVGAGGKTTFMFRLVRELSATGVSVLATTTTKVKRPSPGEVSEVMIAPRAEEVLIRLRQNTARPRPVFAAASEILSEGKLAGFPPEAVDFLAHSGLFPWTVVEADGAAQRPVKAPAEHEPVIPDSSGWVVGVLGLDAVGRPLNDSSAFRPERLARLSGLAMGKPISPETLAAALVHPEGILKGCPEKAKTFAFLNKADTPKAVADGREVIAALQKKNVRRPQRVGIGRLLPETEIIESCGF